MSQYEVTASDSHGKTVRVRIEADSAKTARQKARGQGLTPISVATAEAAAVSDNKTVASQLSFLGGIKAEDLSNMTRQLATLVKAHVPIVESLNALVDQIDNPKLKSVLMDVRQAVKEGKSLGDGLAMHPKHFDRVYINMVKAGESSGRLDVVLLRLADFAENQDKLKNKVMGALTYPIIMVVVAFGVLGVVFTKVVPQITAMFTDMKTTLPTPTRVLIGTADFAQAWGIYVVVGILGALALLQARVRTPAGRAAKDRALLKLPLMGILIRKMCVARFARTLGTLLASGVPMLTALQITKNVVSNVVFEDTLERAGTMVSEGKSLSLTLRQSGEFPPIVVHMVGVGEKSGELEAMLLNVAESYEHQVDTSLGGLTSLLEPIMMVCMALVVGFIVMAVLLPIFEMNNFS